MKKIISAIFLSLLCFCVRAEESGVVYDERQVYISAAAFEDALNKFVADDYKAPAAAMFLEKRDANTGKINLSDMLRVCVAANITYCLEHPDDPACKGEYSIASYKNDKCDDFVEYVLSNSRGAIDLDRAIGTEALCGEWNGLWLPMETGGHKCVGLDGYVLKYSYSCKKGKSGTCVSDFKQLKTQSPIAKQFISSYGKKQGLSLTCLNNYVKRGAHGFMQCTAGGKAYEFEFNNLNKNPDKDSIESENKMLCDFFGGTVLSARDDTDKKYNFRCDVSQDICNGDMKTLAQKIGHTINYTTGACVLGKDALKLTEVELNRIEGIDSNRFLKNQLRSEAAQRGVEEYLINQYGAKSAKCGPEIYTLADSSAANAKYVLRCKADGRAVDFVFEDLTEKIDYVAAAGASRMACESLGGRGDDRNCRGLEPAECVKLNDVLIARGRAGTHYDTTLGGCILNDAEIAHNVDLGLQIASGVVLTVATVGMSSVPVVVLVGASVAIDLVFEAVDAWTRRIPYNDYKRFMASAEECGDISSEDSLEINKYCVMSVFSEYAGVMSGDLPELSPEVRADTVAKLIEMNDIVGDEEIVRKLSVEEISNKVVKGSLFALILLLDPDKLLAKMTKTSEIIRLGNRASKSFGKYYDDFIKTGKSVGLPVGRMEPIEWNRLNQLLKSKGVELVDDVANGKAVKVFRKIGDVSDNIDDLLRKYSKKAELRSGATNSLGHDYYRIIINDNEDVGALIDDLRRNGFFVSAGQTKGGEKFIGVARENVFQRWDNVPTNWLKDYNGGSVHGRGIFDKIYNNMPESVLKRKLDYVYSVIRAGGSNLDIVNAMKSVGAFDEYKAGLLAQDIADETIRRISSNPELVQKGKNWNRLSYAEKRQFVENVHDIITRERRVRAGDTVIGFGDIGGAWGQHRAPGGNISREFDYDIKKYRSVRDALDTIIHENVHSFQSVNKSSIPEQLELLSRRYYVRPEENFNGYQNVLIEVEARYVAERSTPQIAKALGW